MVNNDDGLKMQIGYPEPHQSYQLRQWRGDGNCIDQYFETGYF